MRFSRTVLSTASVIILASASYAAAQDRITPQNDADTSSILTTHRTSESPAPAPVAAPATDALPWKGDATPVPVVSSPVIVPAPSAAPISMYQPKSPFGHAEPMAPIIPEGPHATVAVPVVNVQSLEAPEAQPPTPAPPQADPAQENPENPTELTSPIFGDTATNNLPRKIIFRLLNKVTAQSTLYTLKPNEVVKAGQLEITAITCQTSAPKSQTDYAGLFDIEERSQDDKTIKPLFRGWMYASSPSITALEHPVYDVTMVECETPQPVEKPIEKPAKKGKK